VLKKAGAVAAIAVSLSLISAPAFASTSDGPNHLSGSKKYGDVTFSQAYHTVIRGGTHLGKGVGEIVAGVYTGVIETPNVLLHELER
jgi:hypothetical protein